MSDPHLLLTGHAGLALAMPREDMLPAYHAWENDATTLMGYGNQVPQAWEVRAAGWERQRKNHNYVQFEIVRTTDAEAVGLSVLQVNTFVHTAEFVLLIAPTHRGKGYATEASRLTLDWGFHITALRAIWLKVLAPNTAAIRAYEKAGFHHAGRMRAAGYWLGQPTDELIMDALPTDFPGPSAIKEQPPN